VAQGQQGPRRQRTQSTGAMGARAKAQAKIAAKVKADANDPDEVREALDDAAGMSRNLWLAFLTFGTYLAIGVGSVTHRDLFLATPINMPLLNVALPLVDFFRVAPFLLLIFHAYLLLNLRLMVDNVRRYNEMLSSVQLTPREADNFRLLLTNFPFVQLLSGTTQTRRGYVGGLLLFIVWITVVLAPIVLLVTIQVKFLPYHDWRVTWWHRLIIIADVILLWCFWPSIIFADTRSRTRVLRARGVGTVVTILVVVCVLLAATYPSERVDRTVVATAHWIPWRVDQSKLEESSQVAIDEHRRCMRDSDSEGAGHGDIHRIGQSNWILRSLYEVLFVGDVDEVNGTRNSLWSNTLVLPDEDFVDEDVKLDSVDRTISLRGRDLRGAILIRTDLRKADFTGAILDDADLTRGRFDQAFFGCGKKGSETLDDLTPGKNCTSLLNAKLDEARLRGAQMQFAVLEGASLKKARMQIGDLTGAHLKCAVLDDAQLHGAVLMKADIEKAKFRRAQLHGADLRGTTNAHDAVFDSAIAWRAQHNDDDKELCRKLIFRRYYYDVDDTKTALDLDDGKKVIAAGDKERLSWPREGHPPGACVSFGP
jgi:uncharacterized protein YjbI with pentapeptide repeats